MRLSRGLMIAYLGLAFSFIGLIVLFATINVGGIYSLIGAVLIAAGVVISILFWRYGYLIVPLITQKSRIVMITDTGYEIPPSQDVIVKKGDNGLYYASMFMIMKIYESAVEQTVEETYSYNQQFERAITALKKVTKIGYMVYVEDIQEKRKFLETKKAEAILKLQREREKPEPDMLRIERYEKEVAYWEQQIDKLTRGMRPIGVLAYVMVTEAGITREAAITNVRASAREVQAVLSNALNVEIEVLKADDMLKVFEWERFMPVTPEQLEEGVV